MTKWTRPGGFQSGGWEYAFRGRSWEEIADSLREIEHPDLDGTVAIIESIRNSQLRSALLGTTSMCDLVVAEQPASAPPFPVLLVRVSGSVRKPEPSAGHVIIEHVSSTGNDDRLERRVDEAVPLFWRFVKEKFGLPIPTQHRNRNDG